MADASSPSLTLKRGEDPTKAWMKLLEFVQKIGGSVDELAWERDFFDQWKNKNFDYDEVRFTKREQGENGLLRAVAVKGDEVVELENRVEIKRDPWTENKVSKP